MVEVSLAVVRWWHVSIFVCHLHEKLSQSRHHFLRVLIFAEMLLAVLDQILELLEDFVLRDRVIVPGLEVLLLIL